jgi:hypothetical protein
MAAFALVVAVGVTTSYAARLDPPPLDAPTLAAFQPPEPPEPPRPPRDDNREQPPMRPGEAMPRVMMGGGIQMTASGKFVYILRGDEILQFEATSLEFIKKIKLPAPERPNRRDGERGAGPPARNDDRPPPKPPERDDP